MSKNPDTVEVSRTWLRQMYLFLIEVLTLQVETIGKEPVPFDPDAPVGDEADDSEN